MVIPASTPTNVDETRKRDFSWLTFGVPVGCGIGIAIRNLALGIGIGLLLAALVMLFRAKKETRKIGRVVQVALLVACVLALVSGLYLKK